MENKLQKQETNSYDGLRNMLLPIKDKDVWIVRAFKNSVFYMIAVMMIISTLLVFAAVLVAA